MTPSGSKNAGKLESRSHAAFRIQRIFDGDGSETACTFVFCPACERSLPLDGSEVPVRASRRRVAGTAAASKAEPDANGTAISFLMTPEVCCVREDVSVDSVAALLLGRGLDVVPVVDRDGRGIGVVSIADVARELHEVGDTAYDFVLPSRLRDGDLGPGFHDERLPSRTAADVMTPLVAALPEGTSIDRAVSVLMRERFDRVHVVSAEGKVLGLLSALDLLVWYAGEAVPSGVRGGHRPPGRRAAPAPIRGSDGP